MLLFFAVIILLGEKQFHVPPQVFALIGSSPLDLLAVGHWHALRVIVVWPAIMLAKYAGLSLSLVFSLYVLLCIYALGIIMGRCLAMLRPEYGRYHAMFSTLFLFFWLPLSLLMNGRLIFGFLGISLLIFAQLRWIKLHPKHALQWVELFLIQALGLLLCSVSTGIFTVAFGAVQAFMGLSILSHYFTTKHISKSLIIVNLCILSLFLPYQLQAISKNYNFFSQEQCAHSQAEKAPYCDSITTPLDAIDSALINHGIFRFLDDVIPKEVASFMQIVFACGGALLILVNGFSYIRSKSLITPVVQVFGFSIILGLLGDSTLLMGLVPAQLFICHVLLRRISAARI